LFPFTIAFIKCEIQHCDMGLCIDGNAFCFLGPNGTFETR